MKKSKQINNLNQLFMPVLAWLAGGATSQKFKFNMDSVIQRINAEDYKKIPCKTSVCIMGAALTFQGIESDAIFNEWCMGRFSTTETIKIYFKKIAPDYVDELCKLIIPIDYISYDMQKITPKEAAKVLLEFMMTQKVNWKETI